MVVEELKGETKEDEFFYFRESQEQNWERLAENLESAEVQSRKANCKQMTNKHGSSSSEHVNSKITVI